MEKEQIVNEKAEAKKRQKEEIRNNKALAKKREKIHLKMLQDDFENRKKEKIVPKDSRISLQHINKIYPNHVQAVFDFNLDIKDKEFIVLVGPSGCGKSTTLRMIAGLEDITYGDFYIAGKYGNDLLPKQREIAMVFQNYALYPSMTVYDNMAFSLKVRHMKKAEIDERVQEAAKILGIKDYLYRKPSALSGGQRQRVALGRAIVRHAKVMLMDEPLSNLDAKLRVQMRSEIIKLHQKVGSTTVYVTHDQTEAMTMATRIVVMRLGYIQQIGAPKEIYNNPANIFVATFIGSPAMNILDAKYDNGKVTLQNNFSFELSKEQIKKHDDFYVSYKKQLEGKIADNLKFVEEKRIEYNDPVTAKENANIEKLASNYRKRIVDNEAVIRHFKEKIEEEPTRKTDYEMKILKVQKEIEKLKLEMDIKINERKNLMVGNQKLRAAKENERLLTLNEDQKRQYHEKHKAEVEALLEKDDLVHLALYENDQYKKTILKIDEILKTHKHTVKFGVRPEDIVSKENSIIVKNKTSFFKFVVSLTELLGNEYYVHTDIGETDVISKCGADVEVEKGSSFTVCFNLDHIHIFDEISENRIV